MLSSTLNSTSGAGAAAASGGGDATATGAGLPAAAAGAGLLATSAVAVGCPRLVMLPATGYAAAARRLLAASAAGAPAADAADAAAWCEALMHRLLPAALEADRGRSPHLRRQRMQAQH
eukprot:8508978-Pyramimonas_sp.AAC.1